jgi:hypothetical protein
LYFGEDPAWHFNAAGELRRAYCDGRLYKAEGGCLASLERRREGGQVVLARHDLGHGETQALLGELGRLVGGLRQALATNCAVRLRQVPAEPDIAARLQAALAALPDPVRVARSPRL